MAQSQLFTGAKLDFSSGVWDTWQAAVSIGMGNGGGAVPYRNFVIHGFNFYIRLSTPTTEETECVVRAIKRSNASARGSIMTLRPVNRNYALAALSVNGDFNSGISTGTVVTEEYFEVKTPGNLTHFYLPELRPVLTVGNGTTDYEVFSVEYYPTANASVGVTLWVEVF